MGIVKRFFTIIAILTASLLTASGAYAAKEIYTGTFSSNALNGYDTVAYFTQGKPVKGSEKFQTDYKGAKWQFSSQANLDAFKTNPGKYAPQYGGYCAYAVGEYNDLASADPEAWKIVDGKLYLNYNKDIQAQWAAKQSEYIKKGDVNWPGLIQ